MDSGCFSCCQALKTWSPSEWFVDKISRDEKAEQIIEWPSDPKHYQWKGTISSRNGKWHVLAYCKLRKEDVFIKIKSSKQEEDIEHFTDIATKLINIRHPNLMTPVHVAGMNYEPLSLSSTASALSIAKSQFSPYNMRAFFSAISEVLASHYPNGIPSEEVVASILYDTALGLQNLHSQQQCHRNIRADSLHVDVDEGITLLSNFGTLKTIKWRRASRRKNTAIDPIQEPFTDPLLLLGLDANATWYTADIYAFGITALQLTYGSISTDLYGKRVYIHVDLQYIELNESTLCFYDIFLNRLCDGISVFQIEIIKSFESLIKECCGPLDDRPSVNQLVEHKFFKTVSADNFDPTLVHDFFGHILKSTEQRVDPSLPAPPSMLLAAYSSSNVLLMTTDGTKISKSSSKRDVENLAFCIQRSSAKPTPTKGGGGSGGSGNSGSIELEGTGTTAAGSLSWSFSTSRWTRDASATEATAIAVEDMDEEARELLTLEMEEGVEDTGLDGTEIVLGVQTPISPMTPMVPKTPFGVITPKGSARPKVYKTRRSNQSSNQNHQKMKIMNGKRKESELKKWMEKHNVFERTLYTKLSNSNVKTLKQLKALKHRDLNWMLQSVRVARLSKSKGQKEKQAVDAELANFEILVVRTRRKAKKGKLTKGKTM